MTARTVAKLRCSVVPPSQQDSCGADATHRITFSDETTAFACAACAVQMEQQAEGFKTQIKVEKL